MGHFKTNAVVNASVKAESLFLKAVVTWKSSGLSALQGELGSNAFAQ